MVFMVLKDGLVGGTILQTCYNVGNYAGWCLLWSVLAYNPWLAFGSREADRRQKVFREVTEVWLELSGGVRGGQAHKSGPEL